MPKNKNQSLWNSKPDTSKEYPELRVDPTVTKEEILQAIQDTKDKNKSFYVSMKEHLERILDIQLW